MDSSNKKEAAAADDELDEDDSVIELGQIALLGSSRASLKQKPTSSELWASRRSLGASRRSIGLGASRRSNLSGTLSLSKQQQLEPLVDLEQGQVEDERAQKLPPDEFDLNDEPMGVLALCFHFVYSYKAYFISIISVLAFCMASVLMRCSKFLTGSDHSFIRYII